MKSVCKAFFALATLALFWSGASQAEARSSASCMECHTRKFLQAIDYPALEARSVYAARLDPCPGIRSLAEEAFFTENRITKLNEILRNMDKAPGSAAAKKAEEAAESFAGLRNDRQAIGGRFAKEAAGLRAGLQKVYDQTQRERGESTRRLLIGLGCVFFIAFLVALGAAYRHLNHWNRNLLIFALGGGLALSGCSAAPSAAEKKSPAQEQMERALGAAMQVSAKTEAAFENAVVLAEMARERAKTDKGAAERGFLLAWQTALQAREQAGRVAALNEIAARCPTPDSALKQKIDYNTVLDLRDEIRLTNSRTWALRAVAEQWIEADPKKGREALECTTAAALKIADGDVRDRELMAIASAWAPVDRNRALEIARGIRDPLPKSTALAGVSGSVAQLEEAWKTAESIPGEYARLKTMIAISASAAVMDPPGERISAERISSRILSVKNPRLRSFLFAELVRAWAPVNSEQAGAWAAQIDVQFPSARSFAFLQIGRSSKTSPERAKAALRTALAEAEKNPDAFESAKVRALALEALAGIDPREVPPLLAGIGDVALRSKILARLAAQISPGDKARALNVAEKIPLESFRMKAAAQTVAQWMPSERDRIDALLTDALRAAGSIPDPYRRAMAYVELSKIWGKIDKAKQVGLLEDAARVASRMAPGSAQTEALEALAETLKSIDKAKYQAFSEQIRARIDKIRRPIEEIRLWAAADPYNAKTWAESLPSSFPVERAAALREAASALKPSRPGVAGSLYLQALAEVLTAPEGNKRNRLMSQLVADSALLDKEKTYATILRIRDSGTRDLLLRDAGNAWTGAEPAWAIKAAGEISDGALRLPLFQKIADRIFRGPSPANVGSANPYFAALREWGAAREEAKREETRAIPRLRNALQEMERISDARARAQLMSALAVEWGRLDEEKALGIAERLPPDFAECTAYALIRVGAQKSKWSRKGAESVFAQAAAAAEKIPDPSLKARRLLQLAQSWQVVNKENSAAVLAKAETGIRRALAQNLRNKILAEILSARAVLNPSQTLPVARQAGDPAVEMEILKERAVSLYKAGIEENGKVLEKAWQYAQKSRNPRVTGEIARAWFCIDPSKSAEMLARIEPRDLRIRTLQRIMHQNGLQQNEKTKALEMAVREISALDGAGERLKALQEIFGDASGVDREKGKDLFLQACRIAENELN